MGWFSDAFNPGKKYLKKASRALERAQFTGGGMTTAGGLSAGFSFDDKGKLSSHQSLGQFAPLFQQLLGGASGFFDKAINGDVGMQSLFGQNMQGFQELFNAARGVAARDPREVGAEVTDLLRSRAAPGAQNRVNDMFDRLRSTGGLSNETYLDRVSSMERRQLADEDMGYQLAGIQQGEQSVQNAFGRMMGAQSGMGSIQQFLEGLRTNAFNMGMGSMGGATSLNMLPMELMNMIGNLQSQRSNIALGQATGFTNLGNSAQSTFQNFTSWLNDTSTSAMNNYATYKEANRPPGT